MAVRRGYKSNTIFYGYITLTRKIACLVVSFSPTV